MKWDKLLLIAFLVISISVSTKARAEKYDNIFLSKFLEDKYQKFILPLPDGYKIITAKKTITLTNNPKEEEGFIKYVLNDVIKDRFVVFYCQYYENGSYLMVDLRNGNTTSFWGPYELSPNLTRLASALGNEAVGSDMEILDISKNKVRTLYKNDFAKNQNHFPEIHSWKNNHEIRIVEERIEENEDLSLPHKFINMLLSYNKKSKKWEYKETKETFPSDVKSLNFETRFPEIREYFSDKDKVLVMIKQEEGVNVHHISKNLLDNNEIMDAAMISSPFNACNASDRLKNDYDFMINAVQKHHSNFLCASKELKDNKKFIKNFLKMHWYNSTYFQYFPEHFKDDDEIFEIVIKNSADEINNASLRIKNKFKNDKEFMIKLLKINPRLFSKLSEDLRSDKSILMIALKANFKNDSRYVIIDDASTKLKDDKDIYIWILKNEKPLGVNFTIRAFSENVRSDKSIILRFIDKFPNLPEFLPKELKNDEEFMSELIKKNPDVVKYLPKDKIKAPHD